MQCQPIYACIYMYTLVGHWVFCSIALLPVEKKPFWMGGTQTQAMQEENASGGDAPCIPLPVPGRRHAP